MLTVTVLLKLLFNFMNQIEVILSTPYIIKSILILLLIVSGIIMIVRDLKRREHKAIQSVTRTARFLLLPESCQ